MSGSTGDVDPVRIEGKCGFDSGGLARGYKTGGEDGGNEAGSCGQNDSGDGFSGGEMSGGTAEGRKDLREVLVSGPTGSGEIEGVGKHAVERREGGLGETEPPSKRVAVERPEYTGTGEGGSAGVASGASATGDVVDNGKGEGSGEQTTHRGEHGDDGNLDGNDGAVAGGTDESPAMQFRWLNASSTTGSGQ